MSEDPKNDYRKLIATILRKRHIEYFGYLSKNVHLDTSRFLPQSGARRFTGRTANFQ